MAGRKPKNPPMSRNEMIEFGKQKRATSKIYRAESDELKDESISKSVHNALTELKRAEDTPKIDMDDISSVRSIIECYLETCAISASIPSMAGIAMCLGYTRTGLYLYMAKHDTETARFLHQVHDRLADILAENALKGSANNITAIFLLKSMYGYRDTQTLELLPNSPNSDPSVDELALRAGLLSNNDDFDNHRNYKDKYMDLIGE